MAKRKYPFNDWSKTPEGLYKWADGVSEEARRKFGVDEDDDCPVEIRVIDRTMYERLHYDPVPYLHKAKLPEQIDRIEEVLLMNLDTALREFTLFRSLAKHERKRAVARSEK